MWVTLITDYAVHHIPVGDIHAHELHTECFCLPNLENRGPRLVVDHHSYDQREEVERAITPHSPQRIDA